MSVVRRVQSREIRRAARLVGPVVRVEKVLRLRKELARFLQKRRSAACARRCRRLPDRASRE